MSKVKIIQIDVTGMQPEEYMAYMNQVNYLLNANGLTNYVITSHRGDTGKLTVANDELSEIAVINIDGVNYNPEFVYDLVRNHKESQSCDQEQPDRSPEEPMPTPRDPSEE